MSALVKWLEERTGVKSIFRQVLFENIPGGSRWRYVWGTTVLFALAVQCVTGMALWLFYSPSAQTAWESVYFIQEQLWGGWLLRGIHHHTTSVLSVLLVLHLLQVVISRAYRAPREVNFWAGLGILLLVLGLARTGYLLPWDQQGFWGTKVAANLVGIAPVVGSSLQKILIGGADFGHHTLTRFFALHAGILPAAVVVLLIFRFYLNKRHGFAVRQSTRRPDSPYWPDQAFKDAIACLAVMAAVLFLVMAPWLFGAGEPGAPLAAPADPAENFAAARPEWSFLFLYQFLKLFPRGTEIWGAVVIPSLVLALLFLMPIVGRGRLGHAFNIGLTLALVAGAALLTFLALRHDQREEAHQVAVREADTLARRVKALAASPSGIPVTGAVTLLRNDPLTQGPRLFARHCASCHRFGGHDGTGMIPADRESAADLEGFASRDWLAGLLDPERISTPEYFGATKFHAGRMVRFVQKEVSKHSAEEREQLRKVILALSAEAQLPAQKAVDEEDAALIAEGQTLLLQGDVRCTECHQFRVHDEDATAPDLTGYGSREWLTAFVADPAHQRFYGSRNDRMPSFGADEILDAHTIGLVVDWLRGDWYQPEEQ